MKLNRITISNFGIFYGENTIDLNDSVTMIMGHSGSGKTILMNAFRWVLSDYPREYRLIPCHKRFSELEVGQYDYVKVILHYSDKDEFIFEKTMSFSKGESDELLIEEITTSLTSRSERLVGYEAVTRLWTDFPLRQFHAICIEPDVSMKIIDFKVRDIRSRFDPYLHFTEQSAEKTKRILHRNKEIDNEQLIKTETFFSLLNESFQNAHNNSVLGYLSNVQDNANEFFKAIAIDHNECQILILAQPVFHWRIKLLDDVFVEDPNAELRSLAEISIILAILETEEEATGSHLPIMLDISSVTVRNTIDRILAYLHKTDRQFIIIDRDHNRFAMSPSSTNADYIISVSNVGSHRLAVLKDQRLSVNQENAD